MAKIIVCGAGPTGLTASMMLADDGHDVIVLEKDGPPDGGSPVEAWDHWERNGVAQFRQPHNLFPRWREIADAELPGLTQRLVDAGCVWWDALAARLPPTLNDTNRRPGDERFCFVTGRRPVVEAVIAEAAVDHAGVDLRRRVGVAEVLTGPADLDGVPHVAGVRTTSGEVVGADLVVDAMGRRSKLGDWLGAVGARPPRTESEDSGFTYYTRFFSGPELPEGLGPPVAEIGTFNLLTLPGDNGTWSVTLWAASADKALTRLRDVERWTRVVGACPLYAHWLEGTPITDVVVMGAVLDRYRGFVIDGAPVATGVAAVGDAWACTNPSAGRGITVGLIHAQALRDTARSSLGDGPGKFALAWDEATAATVTPFFRNQIAADRARIAVMDALRAGLPVPSPPDPVMASFLNAAAFDADVFRGMLECRMCLDLPQNVLARPGFMDKVATVGHQASPIPGPDRARLLELVG